MNAVKVEGMLAPGAPMEAKRSGFPFLRAAEMDERALKWMGICAAVGSLYFLGICAGYLIFAAVLPEFRLAFFFGGIFAAVVALRLVAFWFGGYPTKYGAGLYGVYGIILVIQALWYLPIAN